MKKKVRIYKSPDGNGKYINKTAQFLNRMDYGGQPSVDELGYPGAAQEAQADPADQLAQVVLQDINDNLPYEASVAKLVNAYDLDPAVANQFVQQIYATVESQVDKEKSDEAEVEEEEKSKEVEKIGNEIVREKKPMSKIKGNTDLAMEDTGDDNEGIGDDDMLKYGGMPRKDEGGETDYVEAMNNDQTNWPASENPIVMPGVSDYIPFDISEYLDNNASSIAWSEPTDEVTETTEDVVDYTDPVVNPEEFRMGGFKTKKGYVNSILKLVKKAAGGDNEEQDIKASDADPRGDDLRKNRLDAFVGAVKREGNASIAKQKAEEAFEEMQALHKQSITGNPDLQSFIPEDYDQDYGDEEYMQFGGQRRAMRQLNRAMRRMPAFPGMYGPVTKFDVRRSGIFGRPKEYSIEFGQSPLMQLAGNPFLSQAYGYGYSKKKTKTPGRLITETVRNTVNNKSTKDVAKATGSEAANKSVNWDMDNNSIPDNIQSKPVKTPASSVPSWITDPVGTAITSSKNATPVARPTATPSMDPAAEIFGKNPPRVGETNSAYLMRVTGNPGFYNNTDVWDGTKFTKVKGQTLPPVYNASKVSYMRNKKDEGGMVDNPMPDQFGNLQQFVYGGLDQSDIDDVYSKDVTDPYFQYGGLTTYQVKGETDENTETEEETDQYEDYRKRVGDKLGMSLRDDLSAKELFEMGNKAGVGFGNNTATTNKTTTNTRTRTNPYGTNMAYGYNPQSLVQTYFPANLPQRHQYLKKTKGPYNKNTGEMFKGIPGFNPYAQVQNITGKGRKFSVTYNTNPTGKPEDRKLAFATPGSQQEQQKQQGIANKSTQPKAGFSNTDGLSFGAKRQIRQGEREMMRNDRRAARNPEGKVPFMLNAPGKVNQAGPTQKQYGGDMEPYLPIALYGTESPVSMVDSPVNNDLRMPTKSSKEVGQQMMMDSRKKLEGEANYMPDEYTEDYKVKSKWLGDRQGAILSANAAVEGLAGGINRFRNRKAEARMYDNLTADNLYAKDPSKDSGDYDINTGLYRPDDQGQTWGSRSAQYGGTSNYSEGDEVEMTEEELEQFLANGGEVEYLNY
jgi:hypothetical protein